VGPATALVASSILGKDNLRRRLVNEYTRVGDSYQLTRMSVEFSQYLHEVRFQVIEVPEEYNNSPPAPSIDFLFLGDIFLSLTFFIYTNKVT